MKRPNSFSTVASLALCAIWTGCSSGLAALAPPPANMDKAEQVAVFSATRQINALTLAADGSVWAATAGGVLHRDHAGHWRKWTTADGLPSHEVARIAAEGEKIKAVTPRGVAVLEGETWRSPQHNDKANTTKTPLSESAAAEVGVQAVTAKWQGQTASGRSELKLGEGDKARHIALPPGRGSHISALAPQGNALWAALYGDGVWSYDGVKWIRLEWKLPEAAREVTALAGREDDVWLGTRRNGIWHYDGISWQQHLQANEPFDVNIQNMAAYNGELWCSSLESGLVRFDGRTWQHVGAPQLSSDAPRQLATFNGVLWVRHGGGRVDSWDGTAWKRNALPSLPRGKAFALAADTRKLYVGQWGGWSEWDGKNWTHNLRLPELQGIIILTLLSDGDNLWIGTQNRGLAFFDRSTGTISWNDERSGLQDDWITVVAKKGSAAYAGTFVGGLAEKANEKAAWQNIEPLRGQNITAVEADEKGSLYATTRHGIWMRRENSRNWINLNAKFDSLDTEAQVLCPAQGGMWIGTRTGLFFIRDASGPDST